MLNNEIIVNIQDGGLGRLSAGKDFYTGVIFQSTTKPSGFGSANIKRVYSLKGAVSLGLTSALFPVEYYHISEYFRILSKLNKSGFLDVGFFNITTDAFDGTEIATMQTNANGELRQIGVYLIDTMKDAFVTAANTVAQALDDAGTPVSVYLVADITDYAAVSDLRALNKKWVSTCIAQDGAGAGAALFTSEGYSISCLGALLATTACAKVHESIGWVGKFDISDAVELDTLALSDGTLISELTDAEIDSLNTKGYSLLMKRKNVSGSYWYVDAPTASIGTSDYYSQRQNRTVAKAKRLILQYLAPAQGMPLYLNPANGQMTEITIASLTDYCENALREMAIAQEISTDVATGTVPKDSISINPTQNVIVAGKVEIIAKIVPVGSADSIEVSLGLTTQI